MAQPENHVFQAFAKALRQALLITVTAAALGLIVNALRPQGLDLIRSSAPAVPVTDSVDRGGPQPIELSAALEKLKKESALFIDARSEADYNAGHIQSARNFPEKTFDIWMPDFFNNTPPEALLIIYCSDPRCHLAEHLAEKLYALGYPNVRILAAGWDGWLAAGHPVELGLAFSDDKALSQTTDCASGECRDTQTSPAETVPSDR